MAALLIFGLLHFGLIFADTANTATAKPTADIVYSARYYKPGTLRSHYKIWRTDPSGSRRLHVTLGNTEDHSPIWLADGKTILFVREATNTRTLCTVHERGGPVTHLATLPPGYTFIESVAPNRSMVVYLVRDSSWNLVLFDITTSQERALGQGFRTAWSPDSRLLYVTKWEKSQTAAFIVDLATGNKIPLSGDLREAAFLSEHTLVAELFAEDEKPARLAVLRSDGTTEREVTLPFTWDDETDDLSPFADNLFAIQGYPDAILYGRHAGNSTAGPAQKFYWVNLKGGEPIVVASGLDLAWSSDRRFFVTGDGRSLARLDRKRKVWVSPLSVVSLATGQARQVVQGLVSVGGFDWRPRAQNTSDHLQEQLAPRK